MTKDTFVKIVRDIVSRSVTLHDSQLSKLNAIAREHSDPLDVSKAMEALRDLFGSDIDRKGYQEIEKRLSRY